MISDKDIRLGYYEMPAYYFEIAYLILLLEDPRYSKPSADILRRVKPAAIPSILSKLTLPYNRGTRLEQELLSVLKGREAEAVPAAEGLLVSVQKWKERLQHTQDRMLLNNIDSVDEILADNPFITVSQARSIHGGQLLEVVDMLRPARNGLDSLESTLRSIIKTGQQGADISNTGHFRGNQGTEIGEGKTSVTRAESLTLLKLDELNAEIVAGLCKVIQQRSLGKMLPDQVISGMPELKYPFEEGAIGFLPNKTFVLYRVSGGVVEIAHEKQWNSTRIVGLPVPPYSVP